MCWIDADYDPIRQDARFVELLALLESKETHTPRYLREKELKTSSSGE